MATQSSQPSTLGIVEVSERVAKRRNERLQMRARMKQYMQDPFLSMLYEQAMGAGRFVPITLDLTHVCQLRCEGCYFFSEQLDNSKAPKDEAVFEEFVRSEKARGTNFITVIGGEPTLRLGRLKKLHDNFRCVTVTNGLRKIPYEGFETMGIAVSVWGGHETDKQLRGAGKVDVFAKALRHYKDDRRVTFYFTVSNGNAGDIEDVVDEIVDNGNLVAFSFYEDWANLGGDFDQTKGYDSALREIYRMIDKHPGLVLTTAYTANIASGRKMFDLTWGHDTCPVVSSGYDPEIDEWHGSEVWRVKNQERLVNGEPYYPNHRAVMPDLKSVRRCSVGEESDCSQCHNAYARYMWVMLHRTLHTDSEQDFINWLTTAWTYALGAGALDMEKGRRLLPEIHERTRAARHQHLVLNDVPA